MNTKKIEVLNKAIQMLENGFDYNWYHLTSCNCGLVVSAAIGRQVKHDEAHDSINRSGIWNSVRLPFANQCPITGLKIGLIQNTLLDADFTKQDIVELEELSNEEITSRCNFITSPRLCYNVIKENLIEYLRAWVAILKEQEPKEQPKEVVKTVYIRVAVPASLSEQAKVLLTPETISQ